ncbi:MAG TPA: bifunctional diaminohydroxyphosphoribosylaminopyrimidine deaminase/5-amino-6-(5-phosphoribosylamino)uracil reductase RibD [Salinimicrobium sp.]|nr:bifunctional diaminohydroxyphosphoribosylaminopyrimidine deaminase/5-amino-6-(5-phosphoribosylamino)uracil reductase RibD [Salinimicrobium sp.]
MNTQEKYLERCLELAKNGLGNTYPNPMVGSVIVYKDKIIGEGWHQKAGEAHAEVNAINSVPDKSLLKKATIYVSLEPCSHFGKTPPCSDLIIASGIKKVVIGTVDPFAKVAGKGIQKLMAAGCEVKVGVLEEACENLNRRFFTFHLKKRPFIILKWAQTQNGLLAPEQQTDHRPVWISNKNSQQLVHKWRSEEQGILVGTNTVLKDNPNLNTRLWNGKNPVRIVLDRTLKIPEKSHVLDGNIKTIVFSEKAKKGRENLLFETIDFDENVAEQICKILYKHQIQSVIVEGGSQTLQTFIDADLGDEARVFTGKTYFKKGISAPTFSGKLIQEKNIAGDELKIYGHD